MCPYSIYLGLEGVALQILEGLSIDHVGTWSLKANARALANN